MLSGKRRIGIHDRDEIKRLSRQCNRWVQFQRRFLPGPQAAYIGVVMRSLPFQMAMVGMIEKILLLKWGTGSLNQASVEMGAAPIRNWMGSHLDYGIKQSLTTNPDGIRQAERATYHRYSSPVRCGGIRAMRGKYGETQQPE